MQNAALLLSLVLVFDVFALRWHAGQDVFSRYRLIAGLIISAIGVAVMLTPWVLLPGLVFDTRSVLLSISGLFFGTAPTLIAMAVTTVLRLYQGGPGVWPGVSTVLVTGTIGLIWRRTRRQKLEKIKLPELYLFGLVTHLIMLGLMFTLPLEMALHTLRNISAPVLLIYPLASTLLGGLMINRLKREKLADERRHAEETLAQERRLLRTMIDNLPVAVYAKDTQGRKTLANLTDLQNIGLPEAEVLGRTDTELFPTETAARFEADDWVVLNNGTPIYDREELLTNRNGKTFWQLTSKVPLYNADGQIIGLVGIGRDVSGRKRAMAALQQREADLKEAQSIARLGRWELNLNTEQLQWSDSIFEILEIDPEHFNVSYESFLNIIHPDDRAMVDHAYTESLRQGTPYEITHRVLTSDGQVKWLHEICHHEYNANGQASRSIGVVQDITIHKQAEEALRESEKKYRTLFEQMTEGFALHEIITDAQGLPCNYRFLEVNPAFEQITGYTREHYLGKTLMEVLPNISPDWVAYYEKVALTGEPMYMEEYVPVEGRHYAVWAYRPRPRQLATLIQDFTERRQQELERAALLEAEHEQRLRAETLRDVTLALASTLGVSDVLMEILHQAQRLVPSTASNIALVNDEALRVVGWRDYTGHSDHEELVGMVQPLSEYPINAELVASGEPYITVDTYEDPRWQHLPTHEWIRAHISLPINLGEHVLGVLRLDSDQAGTFITQDVERLRPLTRAAAVALENAQLYTQAQRELEERIRSQAALEASERKFREMLENIRLFAVIIDLEGQVTFCNDFGLQLVGMERDAVLGCNWFDTFIPPEIRAEMDATFAQRLATGDFPQHYENEILIVRDGDGTARALIAWNNMVVRGSDGETIGVAAVGEDITARRQVERALQASEAWLRSLVESMDDVIFSLDTEQRHTAIYGQWVERLGMTEAHFLGRTACDIFGPQAACVHETANLQALATGHSVTYEWEMNGHHFQTTLSPLRDPEGEVSGLVGVGRDITTLKDYQAQLQAALDEKTLMLSEIHHRIKNNLQVILGLLDLQFGIVEEQSTQQMLRESQNRIKAIALIHERLYQTPGESRVNARLYFHSLVRYLTETYDAMVRGIVVEQSIDNMELDIDLAIPCALIVNELISNALKYAFPAGKPSPTDAPPTLRVMLQRTDGHARLAVADNGVGLPENLELESAPHLGLRLIKMLARQIDGELSVEQNEGTCIAITFAWSED